MNVRAPAGATTRSRRSGRSRSPIWLLTWLLLAALICFLIAVASGLISDKVGPSLSAAGESATGPQGPPWGTPSSYLGRYHLSVLVPKPARVSDPNRGTTTRGIPEFRAVSGNLTLFLRVVKHGEPLAPSGILALRGTSGSELVYLTYLISDKGVLDAEINGGAYLGPVIGSFSGFRSHGAIVGIIGLAGSRPVEVRLTRYSRSAPSP